MEGPREPRMKSWMKVVLGVVVGAALGFALHDVGPAWMAAIVTVVYRAIAAFAYRNRPLVRVMAQEVPAAELRYVVPFEARSKYVGADYVQQLAELRGGTFRRNPPDVGILASLDSLDGPDFDARLVHPLIREFYEHTSRFKLTILPEWRPWMKPGLLPRMPAVMVRICPSWISALRGSLSGKAARGMRRSVKVFVSRAEGNRRGFSSIRIPAATLVNDLPTEARLGVASRWARPK